MEREQFTFYASFARAVSRIRRKADRCAAYDAIVRYALYEELPDPESLPDAAAIVFELVRPNLDASREKAKSGTTGGQTRARNAEANGKQRASKAQANPKQTGSKTEANPKQTASKKENKSKNETEYESTPTPAPPPEDVKEVMAFFLDRVNASPSTGATAELRGFTERLGAPVVLHALGVALDERKTAWSYIRAILRRYESEGLKSVEAVQQSERERDRTRPNWASGRNAPPGGGNVPVDMDGLRHLLNDL